MSQTVELTKQEAQQIIFWVNARIPQCEYVLSDSYREQFLKNRTEEQIEAIYADRKAELEMLKNLGAKMEVVA